MDKTNLDWILENYFRNPFRNLGLSLLIALFASVLLIGGLLSISLSKGLHRLSARLGADVIVIPQGSEINDQSVLLQGDSKYTYLPQGSLEFIRSLPGVKTATPQYYITTLSASCCDQKVSIIGFDTESDFVIQPWIREVLAGKLPKGSIVVGSEIRTDEKKTLKIFDREFPVAATLEPIGNKLDQAVFVDEATLANIREAAESKGIVFLKEKGSTKDDVISYSSILIQLNDGADVDRLSREIHSRFDGVQFRTRKDLFTGLQKSASFLKIVVWVIVAIFWIVTAAVIMIAFSLSTRERKREYALLRMIGFTRKRLQNLVLGEALLVSVVGTYIGLFFASVFFFAFRIGIREWVEVPFILPSALEIVGVYVSVAFLLLSVGPAAVYGVANKVSKIDAYVALREGED